MRLFLTGLSDWNDEEESATRLSDETVFNRIVRRVRMRQETGGENVMRKRTIQQLLSNERKKSEGWKKCFGLLLACGVMTLTFGSSVYAAVSEGNHITAAGELGVLSSEFDDDEKVISLDDRVKVKNTKSAPYKYVGKLTFKQGNGYYQATGELIGKKTVLTAAHCAYGENGLSKSMRFYPAQDGVNNPYGSYEIAEIHVPEEYKKAVKNEDYLQQARYDYAVLTLKKSMPTNYGYFSLGGDGTSLDKKGIKNLALAIIGYPGEKSGMYRHASKSYWFEDNDKIMAYKIDTTGGQSGSPVYRKKNGKYYIIAVHAWGYKYQDKNGGRYLDSTVKKYIQKYAK